MALAKEMLGTPLKDSLSSRSSLFLSNRQFYPEFLSLGKDNKRVNGGFQVPKAAISTSHADLVVVRDRINDKPEKPVEFNVIGVVTIGNKQKGTLFKQISALTTVVRRNIVLELYSTDIDPETKSPKKSNRVALKGWLGESNPKTERVNYTVEFTVDTSFGTPGAVSIINKHKKEFYLESITIEGFAHGPVHFPCNSWVQSTKDHPGNRIFFSNQPYLPHETPEGLRAFRDEELKNLRGDGTGVRKLTDRIYDYDVYNDLGNPDKGIELVRPIIGGDKIPYPRRCRTGRPPFQKDNRAESRVEKPHPMYVPRDDQFEEPKFKTFSSGRIRGLLHNLGPLILAKISTSDPDIRGFPDIDSLYSQSLLSKLGLKDHELFKNISFPKLLPNLQGREGNIFKYDTPQILSKDRFAWLRDDEFAREMIAGVNPGSIERLKVFPPVSKLDPEIYGSQKSALKEEHILGNLNGMTVEQALKKNKLYIVDFHDIYIPFLDKINSLDGRKAYATRTILFLTPSETLKPIAIELGLPQTRPSSRPNRVVTPPTDATMSWMWQLAKVHVWSNDAGVHQLVNHWLRTHACLEPFILAAHRQLSVMHPIFKLLDPHMRYNLEINALARQRLISADGVMESCFTPGPYITEISSAAYKNFWRFDLEGLPADLIRRGMALEDPTQLHGVRLLIEDYPYAADGLLVWDAIKKWVHKYVGRYYLSPAQIRKDKELQSWYTEAIHVGHADLSEAKWWPQLETPEDLSSILTTIIWLASAQHAALNFGQYPYGGYTPNRPTLMRRLIPNEMDPEYEHFLANPEKYFFSALPSLLQATMLMSVVETLSTHSPDEEYLGERRLSSIWSGDIEIVEEFYKFSAEIRQIEKEIERRNNDRKLKNRCGAGVPPYELFVPSSGPGVTFRGVPNSVTI